MGMRVSNTLAILVLLASVSVQAADINTALADAAESRNVAKLRTLITDGNDINAAQVDGMTALHWAVYYDDLATVKLLLANKAKVNAKNRYRVSSLSLACTNGNEQIVQLLLDAGADPNAELRGGETVLMTAARTGKPGPVKALIAAGADVNETEAKDQTAVMWAAADGHADVVQLLLDAGAEFETSLDSGFSPLFFAVREGHTEVVRVLLDAGAYVNQQMTPESGKRSRRTNPLLLAVENGHFETAAFLLDNDADPNAAPSGFTALHAITWVRRPLRGDTDPPPIGSGNINSLDFVRHLVKSGANVDARWGDRNGKGSFYGGGNAKFGNDGSTAFLLACRSSDVTLIRLLLKSGADWTISNGDGCTALLAAAGVGALGSGDELPGSEDETIENIRLLIKLGADINAVAKHGETAIHGAVYHERPKVVEFLADNGADIEVWNQKNKFGWTPLMIAYGHRPGNFRPSPKTITAVTKVMRAHGVEPPPDKPRRKDDKRYR